MIIFLDLLHLSVGVGGLGLAYTSSDIALLIHMFAERLHESFFLQRAKSPTSSTISCLIAFDLHSRAFLLQPPLGELHMEPLALPGLSLLRLAPD